jgi:hypothetical protein
MQFNRVFAYSTPTRPDITPMPMFWGYYERGDLRDLDQRAGWQSASVLEQLAAQPPERRVLVLRWMLVYEMHPEAPHNADLLAMLELGRVPVSRAIRILRPTSRALKEQRMRLAGVWCDTEGFLTNWGIPAAVLNAAFRSSKARANMPPRLRAMQPEFLQFGHPRFRQSVLEFNRWGFQLTMRALRQIMVEARLFHMPGDPLSVIPPMSNYMVMAPTWPVYDGNGWPWMSQMIDGRTSSVPIILPQNGERYRNRIHDFHWNAFIDLVNRCRSCIARPNALAWPFLVSAAEFGHPWIYEQVIAHMLRTGLNASNGNNIIWYNPLSVPDRPGQETLMVNILNRHDEAFPVQRGLPEIPLDSDRVETAGYVTTYEDYLANTDPALASAVPPTPMTPMTRFASNLADYRPAA